MVFYVTQDTKQYLAPDWIGNLWSSSLEVENLVRLMKGIPVVVKKTVVTPASFMYVLFPVCNLSLGVTVP